MTFEHEEQTQHRDAFIHECRHKAWSAACHAEWVANGIERLTADKVKLCFQSVLRDAGIQRLIQDGYLSRYHHYTIPAFNPQTVAQFYLGDPTRWGKTILI